MARNIFIGDIHGCFDELQELLSKLKIKKDDKVYLVGDMINRGPKSVEVVDFLYKNRKQFFAVKGNHERGFLEYIKGEKPEFENPEYIQLKHFFQENPDIYEYFKNIPFYREEKGFRVAHAGVVPGMKFEDQDWRVLSEIYFYKELPWYFSYPEEEKTLIYGHWAGDGLHIRENTIGLDTGCVIGGKLSAYVLEEEKIVQVKSHKQYFFPSSWGYEAELSKKGIFI